MPQLNLCYITHLYRCTTNSLHRDIGNILQALDGSDSSDIILVGIFFDIASTGIGIVLFQRIKHFANGNIVGIQLVSIHCHLILLHITAPTAHFCNTGSSRKLLSYYPVLQSSQLGKRVFMLISILGSYRIMVDFTQSGSNRSHFSISILWQLFLYLSQYLAHLRTSPIDICLIIKHQGDDRETTTRNTSTLLEPRNVGECHFHRSSYILFHFLRSKRRGLGYHLNLIISNIRSRIKWKMNKGPDAPYH